MISVVIPSLHSPVIGAVIGALRTQSSHEFITEIVVVGQDRDDQIATDDLVRFVQTDGPLPAAAARNVGVRATRGPLLLFIDADCVAEDDLITQLLAAYQAGHPVVGGALGFAATNYWSISDHLVSFADFLPGAPAGGRRYLLTANLLIERRLVELVGGFDESFPGAAGEDVDLSLRLRREGLQLWFEPRAIVKHLAVRRSCRSAMRHLAAYGRAHAILRSRYPEHYLPLRFGNVLLMQPRLLILAAPLIAAIKAFGLLWHRPELRNYWYVLPAITLQQLAWCWGLAQRLRET
ncbi:MAG: hypothetical protein NVSMB42_05620 [Herpetosiphon sp.]